MANVKTRREAANVLTDCRSITESFLASFLKKAEQGHTSMFNRGLNDDLISVVMTTYHDKELVLCRAINSLLSQDYPHVEIVIVFEPGDENFFKIANQYRRERVVSIQAAHPVGRCGAYNIGIRKAGGRFLARMDSDDESLPQRFSRQVEFLRCNPDVTLVGSAVNLLDKSGNFLGVRHFPQTHREYISRLAFVNPICHPTVIWDRCKFAEDSLFSTDFNMAADDMELWLRWTVAGHRFANLPDCLLNYTQPENYARSRLNWRYMLAARWRHKSLCKQHPAMLIGLLAAAMFSVSPQWMISLCTGRSRFSDWFRSIR